MKKHIFYFPLSKAQNWDDAIVAVYLDMSRRSGFAATLGALFRTQAPSVGSGGARVGDDGRGEEVENDVTAAKHSGKSTSFKARRRFKPKCRTYQTHFNFAPSKENIPVEPIKRPREAQNLRPLSLSR